MLDGLGETRSVISHKLRRAINDGLRGVDGIEMESAAVLVLALVDFIEREGIAPAEVIPVSDVLAEDDGLGAGNGLFGVEFFEKTVGGRAVGAAFRGEQFDQNRYACGILSRRLRFFGGVERAR